MAQHAKDLLQQIDYDTQKYVNDLQGGSNNMLVAIRVRPLLQKQAQQDQFEVVRILDQKVVVLLDPGIEFASDIDVLRKNRNQQQQFAFDYAFDQTANQQTVYETTTQILIDGVLDGFNATIFAYGATGAGKTYTMVGSNENPGIMYRCMSDLFSKTSQGDLSQNYFIQVSYMEIYNENIKDLLSSEDRNLDLRQDPVKGSVISGITEVAVESVQEIMSLLKVGNRNRTKQATAANQVSSRSHAILQVQLEMNEKNQSIVEEINTSKLSLVDLAGSQRAAATSNRGIRMLEGAQINQSLLVLGNCIQSLAEANQKGIKNTFVPYRGSQLTRLLKDSLGGNCRTIMIANISPNISTFQDTYNTLNYANRAQKIKTNVQRNVLNVNNHITNYASVIETLKKQNESLKKLVNERNISAPSQEINSSDREGPDQLEKQIDNHFNEEMEILKQLFTCTEQSENYGYRIFQMLSQSNRLDESSKENMELKDQIESAQVGLNGLNQTQDQLTKQYNNLLDKRNNILTKIRSSQLNNFNLNYIMGFYQQQQLVIENSQVQFKDQKSEGMSKQKEQQIDFLQRQLKLRDDIIQDQKQVLSVNNIRNRITYSALKDQEDIDEEAKLSFPAIQNNMHVLYQNSPRKTRQLPKEEVKFPKINNIYERNRPNFTDNSIELKQLYDNDISRYKGKPSSIPFYRAGNLGGQKGSVPILNKYNNPNYQDADMMQRARDIGRYQRLNHSLNDSQLSMNDGLKRNLRSSNSSYISTASSGKIKRYQDSRSGQNLPQTNSTSTLGVRQIPDYHQSPQYPKNVHVSPYVFSFQKKADQTQLAQLDRLQKLNRNVQNLQNRIKKM